MSLLEWASKSLHESPNDAVVVAALLPGSTPWAATDEASIAISARPNRSGPGLPRIYPRAKSPKSHQQPPRIRSGPANAAGPIHRFD
jgi:hypothetical protein